MLFHRMPGIAPVHQVATWVLWHGWCVAYFQNKLTTMATLKKERFGTRHTERIIATDGDNGPRGVFNMSYRAGDRSRADTLIRLEFRVTNGPRSHHLHTLELSGAELVDIVRRVATSSMQLDHESAFALTDALRTIFNR